MFADRFAVKQLGTIDGNIALWPGDIPIWLGVTATAIAPVTAMPTTAAHLSLFNGAPQGSGVAMVVLEVGTIITTSAGAAINLGLAATITTALVASQTGTACETIRPLTSNQSYGGAASLLSAVTIVDNGEWHSVAPTIVCANTANLMLQTKENVAGRYVVMPGQQFCLASLANAAGSAVCKPFVIWAEVQFKTA